MIQHTVTSQLNLRTDPTAWIVWSNLRVAPFIIHHVLFSVWFCKSQREGGPGACSGWHWLEGKRCPTAVLAHTLCLHLPHSERVPYEAPQHWTRHLDNPLCQDLCIQSSMTTSSSMCASDADEKQSELWSTLEYMYSRDMVPYIYRTYGYRLHSIRMGQFIIRFLTFVSWIF